MPPAAARLGQEECNPATDPAIAPVSQCRRLHWLTEIDGSDCRVPSKRAQSPILAVSPDTSDAYHGTPNRFADKVFALLGQTLRDRKVGSSNLLAPTALTANHRWPGFPSITERELPALYNESRGITPAAFGVDGLAMSRLRIPRLCRHKASNRGYVTDPRTGREHYFIAAWGPDPDTPSAKLEAEYAQWLSRLLVRRREVPADLDPDGLTVAELLNAFHEWSLAYYRRRDGSVTSEPASIAHASAFALRHHAATPIVEFGPLALKEVRQLMVDAGLAREFINAQIDRLRRAWRWGVENELVEPERHLALKAVTPLARGRTQAPETARIRSVPFEVVEKTLPHLAPRWAALVRVHLYCGMRAEEAVAMRPADIDRSSTPWLYIPRRHKTEHRDRKREIWLGPQARAALEPWAQWARPERPIWVCRGRGPHAAKWGPITVSGYRQAIEAACRKADVPAWTPRQLRKTWLTYLRHQHEKGIEASQAIAGHANLDTTELYAEQDRDLGRDAAERFG